MNKTNYLTNLENIKDSLEIYLNKVKYEIETTKEGLNNDDIDTDILSIARFLEDVNKHNQDLIDFKESLDKDFKKLSKEFTNITNRKIIFDEVEIKGKYGKIIKVKRFTTK